MDAVISYVRIVGIGGVECQFKIQLNRPILKGDSDQKFGME
jgi:hypothetical protein